MSDIDAIQSRIMAALDRIGQGLDGMKAAEADAGAEADAEASAELDSLRQQLEDEKLANAQLEERVKQLNKRARDAEEALEAAREEPEAAAPDPSIEAERATALKRLDGELQSLRHANQQLRDNNAALRDASANGVAEPHLINKAMMAELDGLRAARSADRAEMDVILSELARVTGSAANSDDAPDRDSRAEVDSATEMALREDM